MPTLAESLGFKEPDFQFRYTVNGLTFESDVPLTQKEQKEAVKSLTTGKRTDVGDFASLRVAGTNGVSASSLASPQPDSLKLLKSMGLF